MKNKRGITLIALIITIIVLLILASVSISLVVGENGILERAQNASVESKFASYKEEMEMNLVDNISEDNINGASKVTALGKNVKKYIPSLKGNDIGKFGIIAGKLYYIGDNELEKKVAKAQNINIIPEGTSVDEIEKLALEENLKQMTEDTFISTDESGNSKKVGEELINKQAGSNWKIIVETNGSDTVATYGTGWTYIPAGTEIDNLGVLNCGYIINFNNKDIIEFDSKKHTVLAYGSKLAVTKGLFFEITPAMIEDQEIIEDIKYGGYENFEDAYTNSSFIFDGIDDYIEIPYNPSTELKDGFTFQFYGKFLGPGTNYRKSGKTISGNPEYYISWTDEELQNMNDADLIYNQKPSPNYPTSSVTYSSSLFGIMCAYGPPTGYEVKNKINWDTFIRFGLVDDKENGFGFRYNIGHKSSDETFKTEFSNKNSPFNQEINFRELGINDFKYGDEINVTVCVDGINYKQSYYIDGEPVTSGSYSKECWNDFLETVTSRIEKYYIGRTSCDNEWHYGNMEIYGLALYNRGLNATEVRQNNNALVAYHNTLKNGE